MQASRRKGYGILERRKSGKIKSVEELGVAGG